jgi:hypothetical protein
MENRAGRCRRREARRLEGQRIAAAVARRTVDCPALRVCAGIRESYGVPATATDFAVRDRDLPASPWQFAAALLLAYPRRIFHRRCEGATRSTGDQLWSVSASATSVIYGRHDDVRRDRPVAGNWISLALLTFSTVALYRYRVSVEERALLETIGEPYGTYMKDRKRFIPYVI